MKGIESSFTVRESKPDLPVRLPHRSRCAGFRRVDSQLVPCLGYLEGGEVYETFDGFQSVRSYLMFCSLSVKNRESSGFIVTYLREQLVTAPQLQKKTF